VGEQAGAEQSRTDCYYESILSLWGQEKSKIKNSEFDRKKERKKINQNLNPERERID
jgi:hypothetical protein